MSQCCKVFCNNIVCCMYKVPGTIVNHTLDEMHAGLNVMCSRQDMFQPHQLTVLGNHGMETACCLMQERPPGGLYTGVCVQARSHSKYDH